MMKYLWRRYGPNPFDQLLRQAQEKGQKRFLVCWNRGLGDIPLGLYALNQRIRTSIPDAEITYITRMDLAFGFKMLERIEVIADPEWKRGTSFDLDAALSKVQKERAHFDVILENPDPTRWLVWQLGKLTPRLVWDPAWDAASLRFNLSKERTYIGVHVQTETNYSYEKNWPEKHWRALFQRVVAEQGCEILLFGFGSTTSFQGPGIHDLRGRTSLCEMLSLIKQHCRYLVVPDSGILSMTYYIDAPFEIDIVSLWADPKQGVLKQDVASPNSKLKHRPLIAKAKDLSSINECDVLEALFAYSLC